MTEWKVVMVDGTEIQCADNDDMMAKYRATPGASYMVVDELVDMTPEMVDWLTSRANAVAE